MSTSSPAPPPETVLARPGWRSRRRRWLLVGLLLIVVVVGAAGNAIRLPYYAIAPGDALDVSAKVTIEGAKQYEPEGELLLLFVRQRARVNVWRWIEASLDPDIDLFREEEFVGDRSPAEVRDESRAAMASSQYNAKLVALQAVGYEIESEADGARVLYAFDTKPAGAALRAGDVIIEIDGEPTPDLESVGDLIDVHRAGENVAVTFRRGEREQTEEITTEAASDGRPVIGVLLVPAVSFPVEIEIDTRDIGGPSAGLAMTLAVIDGLTPGELTGGARIAVTGTVEQDGSVGEVGGVEQKVVTARSNGADLLLVPACRGDAEMRRPCEEDLDAARDRAGSLEVVEVASVEEALDALERAGGRPLEPAPDVAAG